MPNGLSFKSFAGRLGSYLVIFIWNLLCYLPVAFCIKSLKNDATQVNLPVKLFFSEWLNKGVIPLWNPFLNSGFPVYADPGFAFYNPFTWIFGIIGYNAYTFQLETIFFLLLGSLGFFELGRYFRFRSVVCIVMACLYTSSGFAIGSLEFTNYLTAAAFLPFCILCFYRLVVEQHQRNIWMTALALFLFCTSGHPALPMAAVYFISFFVVAISLVHYMNADDRAWWAFGKRLVSTIILSLLLLSPLLYSWIEIAPFYSRLADPGYAHHFENTSYTAFQLSSLIHPIFSWGMDGVDLKRAHYFNSFVSLFGMITLLVTFRRNWNARPFRVVVLTFVFSLIFLSGIGDSVFQFRLPLLNRLNHIFPLRVFSVAMLIVMMGFSMNAIVSWLQSKNGRIVLFGKEMRMLSLVALLLSGLTCIYLAVRLLKDHNFSDVAVFYETGAGLWIFASLYGMLLFGFTLARGKGKTLLVLVLLEGLLHAWAFLPSTGISKTSVAELHQIISGRLAGERDVPALLPLNTDLKVDRYDALRIGNWPSYYHFAILATDSFQYPSYLYPGLSREVDLRSSIVTRAYAQCINGASVQVSSFGPNHLALRIDASAADTLVYFQNQYPGWEILLNGKPGILTGGKPYLHTMIQSGTTEIELKFVKPTVFWLLALSMASLLIGYFWWVYPITLRRTNGSVYVAKAHSI